MPNRKRKYEEDISGRLLDLTILPANRRNAAPRPKQPDITPPSYGRLRLPTWPSSRYVYSTTVWSSLDGKSPLPNTDIWIIPTRDMHYKEVSIGSTIGTYDEAIAALYRTCKDFCDVRGWEMDFPEGFEVDGLFEGRDFYGFRYEEREVDVRQKTRSGKRVVRNIRVKVDMAYFQLFRHEIMDVTEGDLDAVRRAWPNMNK
jgi:hypothetical protein